MKRRATRMGRFGEWAPASKSAQIGHSSVSPFSLSLASPAELSSFAPKLVH